MKGNSGALLKFSGDFVIKECSNAKEQFEWFCNAKQIGLIDGVVLPYVKFLGPTTYEIEYISGYSATQMTSIQDMQRLINLVEYWRLQPSTTSADWESYLKRLAKHVSVSESKEMTDAFILVSRYELPGSFSHSDLTLENILVRPNGQFVLIDPNYSQDLFQSWVLDYGKLLQSVHSDYHRVFNSCPGSNPEPLLAYLREHLQETGYWELALIAEISHIMRLRSYRPDNEKPLVDTLLRRLILEFG